jgi:mannosidase alpha-like ER degradation enhancer 1
MFLMLDSAWLILGVDSFYEYLLKARVLFGNEGFWRMFHSAYLAVQKYFRHGPWYCTDFYPC